MKIRHRIPSIFNLSMVDVLCCALGCVILLWLVNLRIAKQQTALADSTDHRLTAARGEIDELKKQLQAIHNDRDQALARIAQLDQRMATLETEKTATVEALTKKTADLREFDKKMTAATQRVSALELLVREKDTLATTTDRKSTRLNSSHAN